MGTLPLVLVPAAFWLAGAKIAASRFMRVDGVEIDTPSLMVHAIAVDLQGVKCERFGERRAWSGESVDAGKGNGLAFGWGSRPYIHK